MSESEWKCGEVNCGFVGTEEEFAHGCPECGSQETTLARFYICRNCGTGGEQSIFFKGFDAVEEFLHPVSHFGWSAICPTCRSQYVDEVTSIGEVVLEDLEIDKL